MKRKIAHWNALMALLIFAINENCCSFDWGRGICSVFPSPRQEHLAAQVCSPRGNWPSMAKKIRKKRLCPGASLKGGGGGGVGMGAAGIAWYIILTKKEDIRLSYDLKKCNADLRKCCPPRLTLLDLQISLEYTQPHSVITRYLTLLPFYAICTGQGLIIQG